MTNNIYLLILTNNWRVANLTANINIVPRRETKATRALLNELAAARAAVYHGVKQEAPCSMEIARLRLELWYFKKDQKSN